ncbi:MAG: T9SS type A sorting domain-containing protein [Brumimicrobium sp.]|nr:T9SS type A sorting domain-containing protein [Brumimicrobium sp.]
MKKIYFLAVSLLIGAGTMAQTTVTSHFEGALTDPMNPQIGTYTWSGGNGYVSGTNAFGDKAILQLFDNTYGVTGAGTINSVKIHVAQKNDAGSGTMVTVGIWENNNGTPGNLLGSMDVAISAIDTAQASTQLITDGTTVKGIYNLDVTFSTPITIPANQSYFAGITLPTPTQATGGDTIVVLTTTDGGNYQFADASTHAGALASDDTFSAYGAFTIEIANAIFPTMTFSSNIVENELELVVYPNPAENVLNIKSAESLTSVKVIGMDGRVVIDTELNGNTASLDLSGLEAGSYYYEVISLDGAVSRNAFVKK